jgi:dTDP-4-amino-4,6-dideoxygalactose transaminase
LLYDRRRAALHGGRRLGAFGRAEIFSFHATKVFATMEGAPSRRAIPACTSWPASSQFRSGWPVDCDVAGLNGKMMEVSALIGLRALDTFDAVVAHRAKTAAAYEQRIGAIRGLRVEDPRRVSLDAA